MVTLYGLGDSSDDALDNAVAAFVASSSNPSPSTVANFLSLYSGTQRDQVVSKLIAAGIPADTVSTANQWGFASGITSSKLWGVLSVASGAASAYHGYRRNQSLGWGVWWFLMGSVFPVITPAIGLAQGFGQRKA